MKPPGKPLVIKRILKAERSRVFSALSDPVKMAKWFYGMEAGKARVTCDFRVGGMYSIEMSGDDQKCRVRGEYLEIVPPEKIVFSWSNQGKVTESKVRIELIAKGRETELVLTHELPADFIEDHRQGWKICLDHLETLLEQGDGE